MKVQVTSEHRKRLFATGGTEYKPWRHQLVECDWLRSARRAANRPDLILYKHLKTGAWVVAVWALKPDSLGRGGYMVELDEMWEHPDKWMKTREKAMSFSYLRARLRPLGDQQKEMDKREAAAWALECHHNECTNRQQAELVKYLDKKGPKFAALRKLLQTGEAEYVGDDEGGEALKTFKQGMLDLL